MITFTLTVEDDMKRRKLATGKTWKELLVAGLESLEPKKEQEPK